MEWIYRNSIDNKCRYVLGVSGDKPLICVGINPSTAEPGALDNTMKSVDRIAKSNGFDSWIMLNIYPQRATNPNDMDIEMNELICEENIRFIEEILSRKNATIWAAWGTLINKRKYLKNCLKQIGELSFQHDCNWVTFGKKAKDGHPHHPLYLRQDEKVQNFNIGNYLMNLK